MIVKKFIKIEYFELLREKMLWEMGSTKQTSKPKAFSPLPKVVLKFYSQECVNIFTLRFYMQTICYNPGRNILEICKDIVQS